MDLPSFLLSSHQNLHKTQGATFGNLELKKESFNQRRKTNRHDMFMAKRNISNMDFDSPSLIRTNTKQKKKANSPQTQTQKPSRLELLKKWKQEKELKKKQLLNKRKPLFKVFHSSGLPSVQEAYKNIKGKDVKSVLNSAQKESKLFFPSLIKLSTYKSEKFRPPKNIKPIHFNNAKEVKPLNNAEEVKEVINARVTRSQTAAAANAPLRRKLNFVDDQSVKTLKPILTRSKATTSSRTGISKNIIQETQKSKGARKVGTPRKKTQQSKKDAASTIASNSLRNDSKATTSNTRETKQVKNKKQVKIMEIDAIDLCTPSPPKFNKKQSTPHPRKTGTPANKRKRNYSVATPFSSGTFNSEISNDNNSSVAYVTSLNSSCDSPKTPSNVKRDISVYVSPFVTLSRGSTSARKEYHSRKSDESSPLNISSGPKAGAKYFRNILALEIERLQGICAEWGQYKDENELPDGATDMINVAIGQTQLLITKKFEQFRGLVDNCENQTGEKPVTCEDLHGFWDMVYMQVENLNARFTNLTSLRNNNWEEILPDNAHKPQQQQQQRAPVVKKRGRPPQKAPAKSSIRDAIKAAREKAKQMKETNGNLVTFDGGFFQVQSPKKVHPATPSKIENRTRSSLLTAALTNSIRRRASTSMAVMNVTSSAKKTQSVNRLSEKTPSKSILKTVKPVSSVKKTKMVLFKDSDSEEKENEVNVANVGEVEGNLKRRSSLRLSKINNLIDI